MVARRRWVDRTGVVAAGLFSVALLVRLLYLLQSASGPTFFRPIVDAETYDRLARALAGGGSPTHELFWQPVFYPLFLSVVYAATGSSILAAKLLQAVVGSATCVLTFRLADGIFERRAALLAGLLVAVSGPSIYFDGELLATGWAGFWSVTLLLAFRWAAGNRRAPACAALGVVGALSTLTRPTFLPAFLAGCAWLWLSGRRAPQGARRATLGLAAVAAGFLVLAAPVALLSRAHTGRLAILPASAGLNLYIGNNADAARTIAIRPGWDWKELTQLPRHHGITSRRDTGPFFRDLVLDYARRDPTGFARGLALKAVQMLCSRELPRNTDLYLFRESSTMLRLLVWKVGGFGFPAGLLLPLAALGTVLCFERLPVALRWYLLLYPLSIVLVFVSARYRTPLLPVLAVVAAGGLSALPRALSEKRRGRLLAAGAAALFVLIVGTLGPFPQERANYRAELHYFLGTRALNAEGPRAALEHLGQAVALQPDHSDALNQRGLAHTELRDYRAAIADFEQAVRHNPRSATARTNLARLYSATGRTEEALEQFRTALGQDPYGLHTRRQFGLALVEMGRFDNAIELLAPIVEADPEDVVAREALARAERGRQVQSRIPAI